MLSVLKKLTFYYFRLNCRWQMNLPVYPWCSGTPCVWTGTDVCTQAWCCALAASVCGRVSATALARTQSLTLVQCSPSLLYAIKNTLLKKPTILQKPQYYKITKPLPILQQFEGHCPYGGSVIAV